MRSDADGRRIASSPAWYVISLSPLVVSEPLKVIAYNSGPEVWIGATQIAPGTVRHYNRNKLTMGPFNIASLGPKSPTSPRELERLDTFAKMLVDGGGDITVVRDHVLMQAERWVKLAW